MPTNNLPELLSPAGSPEALRAAVAGGADAVYFGAKSFSARSFAENFDDDALREAINYCHLFGVKTYITVNTRLYEKELGDASELVRRAYNYGADAFITADLGLARIVKALYPDIELHASTQMSGQNALSAQTLASLGFSRMVVPREISADNMRMLAANSPIETEMFIHGALCVSHSGQCLMSSVIGGRSGNRGECAQPCRLPYDCKTNGFPLSLKDLCLAGKISELIKSGVSSLKIEGRMKSPDYVFGVTETYRRLLDERRDARPDEIEALARLFSRSGFTCGYYEKKLDRSMLGVRTEGDKRASAQSPDAPVAERKLPIDLTAELISGSPAKLTGGVNVGGAYAVRTVLGETVRSAEGRAMTDDRVRASLSKLGTTVFSCDPEKIAVIMSPDASMPVSELNALRRTLCDELSRVPVPHAEYEKMPFPDTGKRIRSDLHTAFFAVTTALTLKTLGYFDRVFVPLSDYAQTAKRLGTEKLGVAFPPVAFDSELPQTEKLVAEAASLGCGYALVTGEWQFPIALKYNIEMTGDLRLNCYNSHAAQTLAEQGLKYVVSSVEIGVPRARGISADISAGTVVYGRLPLMTLEKCVVRELVGVTAPQSSCRYCDGGKFTPLRDRTGARFIVSRIENHRNVVWNSVPVWMADKLAESRSAGLFSHFIFTDEDENKITEIINSFVRGDAPKGNFKRI